jgi:uncharacterized membrane protein
MNNIEIFLRYMLGLHIAGGTMALITGLVAMLTTKGGKVHRKFGKIYFWSMTTVFVSAVVLAVGHQRVFLFMVAFFSYFFTVRGYRILFLKGLGKTTQANWLDWLIVVISACFMIFLITWGIYGLIEGEMMGLVGLLFGVIGSTFVVSDIRTFRTLPERMHWWYSHIGAMGGSYISAVTAFVVVNISIPGFGWVLWIIPSVIGGILIGRTIKKYKSKFGKELASL